MAQSVSDVIIEKIIEGYDNYVPNGVLAKKYHISVSTVNRILSGMYKEGVKSRHYPRPKGWQTRILYRALEDE